MLKSAAVPAYHRWGMNPKHVRTREKSSAVRHQLEFVSTKTVRPGDPNDFGIVLAAQGDGNHATAATILE